MKVLERPVLTHLNTFGLCAHAGLLLTLENEEDVLEVPRFDPKRDFILGGGSNVLFVSDVPGTVFLNRIHGIGIAEENAEEMLVDIGAGENWHGVVQWSLRQGLSGIENLSLIPGLAGAAPIQNIGAYGVEIASVLESVTAWDWARATWVVLDTGACDFSYRDSIFKTREPDRYLITSIRLRLSRHFIPQLEYTGLRQALADAGVSHPGPTEVSEIIIALRQRKLPDPAVRGNAGSFFKNPVVTSAVAESLRASFPALPVWQLNEETAKLPAAWLIEHCGLKGHSIGQAKVSRQHALVLENAGGATGESIWLLAREVQRAVHERFGVELEPEPKVYGKA